MKKIIICIILNICIFLFLFFYLDNLVYKTQNKIYDWKTNKHYEFFNPDVFELNYNSYGREISDYELNSYPKPKIKVNETKNSIILFGCSFAYGVNLFYQQTFGYKLSCLLNRKVINRAIGAGSLQHMYYQTSLDTFYEKVPKTNNVIYIFVNDQVRRPFIYTFHPNSGFFYLHYSLKKKELIMDNYKNPFVNFFKSLYIVKLFHHKYVSYFIDDKRNAEFLTDILVLYFIKIRKNLETHWQTKINFNVVIYDNFKYKDILINKLKNEKINVIDVAELSDKLKFDEKYFKDNHPTEAAWDLLTPLIAKKLLLD